MTREEVLQRMLAEVQALQMVGQVRNPYGRELRLGPGGSYHEILFYYAGMRRGDNEITDDELVPIILSDGKVAGWGYEELDRLTGHDVVR